MSAHLRDRLITYGVVLALIFCLTARPVLNAADPSSNATGKARSTAEELFYYAGDLSRSLHDRPSDERSLSDYRRALDAYAQVIRLNTNNFYSAESLTHRAELLREMADAAGDSELYQQAIEAYRQIINNHPHSAFVGDAFINIAHICEENLQDLEGAASAYRELIEYFPTSVMAREANAVLARFEAQLRKRPVDVVVGGNVAGVDTSAFKAQLTNVRNFGGTDYARVVLDLSDAVSHSERREGNRISIRLTGAAVVRSLYGRRFIVGDNCLLKRITVAQTEASWVQIDIQVGSLGDYSLFKLSEPERLILDVHSVAEAAEARAREAAANAREAAANAGSSVARSEAKDARRQVTTKSGGQPLYSLPEIEPVLPANPAAGPLENKSAGPAAAEAETLASKVDARIAESPIKHIVIDPGHGGHDTGTISANGMREKDLVLDVGRRLRAYIKKTYPEVEVILTRDSDRFIALEERTAIANSHHADLFISIHANASPSRVASGVETFFVSPDRVKPEEASLAASENNTGVEKTAEKTPADKPEPIYASVTVGNRVTQSRELARYIQSGLVRGIGAASPRTAMNRGVKHAAFAVLLGASMPSVLAEVSFLSNTRDEALLQTTEFRERIAASLFAGLNAYLKRNRPPEPKAH